MRESDIEVLEKVRDALAKHICELTGLLDQYSEVCDRFRAQHDKQRQNYQENAPRYRSYVKQWRKDNPDKQKKYTQDYLDRKRGKGDSG